MSPGAGLRGRRNRREIINYRVNDNSQTHGQIPGAIVNPFIWDSFRENCPTVKML